MQRLVRYCNKLGRIISNKLFSFQKRSQPTSAGGGHCALSSPTRYANRGLLRITFNNKSFANTTSFINTLILTCLLNIFFKYSIYKLSVHLVQRQIENDFAFTDFKQLAKLDVTQMFVFLLALHVEIRIS